uniref:Uncharacterized protein n=1 Tax=Anguilla anguilla TaxID=7936 RepID=A0A0E9QZJ3_ANGAN
MLFFFFLNVLLLMTGALMQSPARK